VEQLKEQRERQEKKKGSVATSAEMTFLIEGYCGVPPFNRLIVDVRDSLFHNLMTSVKEMKSGDRENVCCCGLFWTVKCCEYLISKGKGKGIVEKLSPYSICFTHEGMVVLVSYSKELNEMIGEGRDWVDK
jgi:hypothetical protein